MTEPDAPETSAEARALAAELRDLADELEDRADAVDALKSERRKKFRLINGGAGHLKVPSQDHELESWPFRVILPGPTYDGGSV